VTAVTVSNSVTPKAAAKQSKPSLGLKSKAGL
jgi:hypothetical protein